MDNIGTDADDTDTAVNYTKETTLEKNTFFAADKVCSE
jgi:hypothetical protein